MGKHNKKHSSRNRHKRKSKKKTFHRKKTQSLKIPKKDRCQALTAEEKKCRNAICYASNRFCKIHFLKKLHDRMIDKEDTIKTMASPVTEDGKIWIGSLASAQHKSFLERYGIRSILNSSGIEPLPHTKKMYKDLGIKYFTFTEIDPDTKEEKFMPDSKFEPEGTENGFTKSSFMDYATKANDFSKSCPKPLLIHCQAGVNRSGSMVAAHLICNRGYSYKKAIRLLENANAERGIKVLTNMQFRKTIEELADICESDKRRESRKRRHRRRK